jgi:DNA-binding NtrC family response regulator
MKEATMNSKPSHVLLLVDDEETIHRALARTLRKEPYELLHANDAGEAAAIIAQRPDVSAIVCDHYMPGTHGLDLLVSLRRTKPGLKTVLLTAQADLQLVMAAINEGRIHRFFTKPWDGDTLRRDLRDLLAAPTGGDAPAPSKATAAVASVKRDMLPPRDELTGAFLIGPPGG